MMSWLGGALGPRSEKVIMVLSGDHAGSISVRPLSLIFNGVCPLPLAFITQICEWPVRDEEKTSLVSSDDQSGLMSSKGYGNDAMDPANPAWVQDRVTTCKTFMAQSGYDGCFLDMLGPSPTQPGYLTGLPVNASTGQPWTTADWLAATAKLQGAIANGVTPVPVAGNGLKSGKAFFDPVAPTAQLLTTGVGDMAESWMRGAGQSPSTFPTEQEWLQDVNLLTSAGSSGAAAFVTVKIWVSASQAQITPGTSSPWPASSSGRQAASTSSSPPPTLRLGISLTAPGTMSPSATHTGPFTVTNGVYNRFFTNGLVVVNPRPSGATVTLSGTYKDLAGNAVSSITLGPEAAEVLTLS